MQDKAGRSIARLPCKQTRANYAARKVKRCAAVQTCSCGVITQTLPEECIHIPIECKLAKKAEANF